MIASAPSAEQRHADVPWRSPENYPATGHIRRRAVRANGLDFPVLEAGNGPLVLCLHGFPDHAQNRIPFIDRLAREGYWAVAPALRGYWVGGAAPDGSYRALATSQLELYNAMLSLYPDRLNRGALWGSARALKD
jgi:alpha-beta hydrolase superfamily lysophospholipase